MAVDGALVPELHALTYGRVRTNSRTYRDPEGMVGAPRSLARWPLEWRPKAYARTFLPRSQYRKRAQVSADVEKFVGGCERVT